MDLLFSPRFTLQLFILFVFLWLVPRSALAADEVGPTDSSRWLFFREGVGAAYGPAGLIADSRVQVRAPMHRSDSIVFQDTFAGIGGRIRVSPAFVDGGLFLSVAPIDVFDLDVNVDLTGTWPGSSGQLLYETIGGKTEGEREVAVDNQQPGYRLTVSAAPTFKIKVGPIIAFDSIEVAWLHHFTPDPLGRPYIYEALRDMLVERRDVVVTHFAAVLYEATKSGEGPVFRFGPVSRIRDSLRSGDGHTAVGGLMMYRKSETPRSPAIVMVGTSYFRDEDRVGSPNIQFQMVWTLERSL